MMKPASINQSNRQIYHCRPVDTRFKHFPSDRVEPLADLFRGTHDRTAATPLLRGKSIDFLPRHGQLGTHGVGGLACFYPDGTQGIKWFARPSTFDLAQQASDAVHQHHSPQFGFTKFNVTGRKVIPTKYLETDYVESETNAEEVMRCYNRAMESYHAIRTLLFVLGKAPPPAMLTQIKQYPKSPCCSSLRRNNLSSKVSPGNSVSALSAPPSTTQFLPQKEQHLLKTCMALFPEYGTRMDKQRGCDIRSWSNVNNENSSNNSNHKSSKSSNSVAKTTAADLIKQQPNNHKNIVSDSNRRCHHLISLDVNEINKQQFMTCEKPDKQSHKGFNAMVSPEARRGEVSSVSGSNQCASEPYWATAKNNEAGLKEEKQNRQLTVLRSSQKGSTYNEETNDQTEQPMPREFIRTNGTVTPVFSANHEKSAFLDTNEPITWRSRSFSEETPALHACDDINKKTAFYYNNLNHDTFSNSDDSTAMSSKGSKSFLGYRREKLVTAAAAEPPLRHCVSAMVLSSSSCSPFSPPSPHSFCDSLSSPSLMSSFSSDALIPEHGLASKSKIKNQQQQYCHHRKQLLAPTANNQNNRSLNGSRHNSQIISSYVVFHPSKSARQDISQDSNQKNQYCFPFSEQQHNKFQQQQECLEGNHQHQLAATEAATDAATALVNRTPTKQEQRIAASAAAWSSSSSVTSTSSQVSGSPSIFTTTAATSSSFVSPLRMTHSDADLIAYEAAYHQSSQQQQLQDGLDNLKSNNNSSSSNNAHLLTHRLLLSNLKQSFWKKFFSSSHDLRQYFIYSHAQFREQSCAMVPCSNKLVSLWKPSQFDILRAMWIDTATITIQKHWRGCKGREKAREELQYKLWILYAAQRIRKLQRCVRTFLHKLQEEQAEILERIIHKRQWAANRLQTEWMHWVKKENQKQEQLVNIIRRVRNTAATELQRVYRGYKTRYFTDVFVTHWVLTWKWDPPGKVVEVVGSFTYPPWRKRLLLMWNPLFRLYMIALPRIVGTHEIKFIVDGQYCCDGGLPIICDGAGHYNNVVCFEETDKPERALRLLESVRVQVGGKAKEEESNGALSSDSSTSLYSTLSSSGPSDETSGRIQHNNGDHEITNLVSHPRWSVRRKSSSPSPPLQTLQNNSQNFKVSDKEVFQRRFRTKHNEN